jgi:hypothetical protein
MAWEITQDLIALPDDEPRVGYREDHTRIPIQAALIGLTSEPLPSDLPTVKFRLRDEDNTVHYVGWLHDDPECENQMAALAFGESDTGACIIEVLRDGEWKQEIG